MTCTVNQQSWSPVTDDRIRLHAPYHPGWPTVLAGKQYFTDCDSILGKLCIWVAYRYINIYYQLLRAAMILIAKLPINRKQFTTNQGYNADPPLDPRTRSSQPVDRTLLNFFANELEFAKWNIFSRSYLRVTYHDQDPAVEQLGNVLACCSFFTSCLVLNAEYIFTMPSKRQPGGGDSQSKDNAAASCKESQTSKSQLPLSGSGSGQADSPRAPANGSAKDDVAQTRQRIQELMIGSTASSKFSSTSNRGDSSASASASASSSTSSTHRQYAFWSTQPVPQFEASTEEDADQQLRGGPIERKEVSQVSIEPLTLLDMFEWSDVDVTNDAQLEEVYKLLNMNYVEDGDSMFRFDYSQAFLRWALMPPGWDPSWHVGVRVKNSRKLVAFITAVPAFISVYKQPERMVEINFLCVHKKLRSKRLAPVLIQEITRRVNLKNIWQAVYTAGTLLPRPVTSCRYYHRSLNPKKLIEVGFSRIAPRMTMARTIRLYALKPETSVPGLRTMTPADVPVATKLLADYNEQFNLHFDFNEEDLAHWLLPRDGVIYSYVVEDPESHDITDLCSFYALPSSVIRHPTHKTLNAAYSFCNATSKTSLESLIRDAMILARNHGFDVFNALDLAHNNELFDTLRFHIGDGELHYYLYNWKCQPVDRRQNALVLL